ncbi:MAG: ATP-binding protein [bacterium]|nr:ATP-binding protein [bacterium]
MQKRFLYYQISPFMKHKNALIIVGMRQVGKTTLMRQLYDDLEAKNKLWFDLDNPLDQKVFEDIDYDSIYSRLKQQAGGIDDRLFVFIDEIQNFPEITIIIKYLIDHYKVKFIVTGSSNYYLKNLFPESLSGRKFLYHLSPLSFREMLYFKGLLKENEVAPKDLVKNGQIDIFTFEKRKVFYEEYMRFGGFPEVTTTLDIATKEAVLKNIFTSFFEKDLRILSDYKDIKELRDLILLLVPRVGSLLNVSKLASELGVERQKVYGYLEFLQGTFFLKLLPKYSKSIDRSVAGGRKVYFSDTGLLNIIGRINDGQLLENVVINQLDLYGKVSFYNQRNSAEIDAILEGKIAMEIKLNGSVRDLVKLQKLSRKLGINDSFVISRSYLKNDNFLFPLGF